MACLKAMRAKNVFHRINFGGHGAYGDGVLVGRLPFLIVVHNVGALFYAKQDGCVTRWRHTNWILHQRLQYCAGVIGECGAGREHLNLSRWQVANELFHVALEIALQQFIGFVQHEEFDVVHA